MTNHGAHLSSAALQKHYVEQDAIRLLAKHLGITPAELHAALTHLDLTIRSAT